jgi:hypothetical protein
VGTVVANLSSIPDDVKWRIAAEFSAKLPALYDQAFRTTVGKRYDEIEQEIWMKVAAMAFDIAKTLSLPVQTARDLAETMRIVMVILFGPDFRSETLEISKGGAVIIIKHCPILTKSYDTGSDGNHTFRRCMAFTLTGIPRLNKDFSARFVRTMCTGDRQCEIKVAKSELSVPDMKIKK